MREEGRLDPVRWRRPGQATLLKSAVVAALLATAAAVMWSVPPACTPQALGATPETLAAGCATDSPTAVDSPTAADPTRDASIDPSSPGAQAAPERPRAPGRPGVPAGTVGVPIRLAEPAALRLIRPGDRVDLFRLGGADARTPAIATAALVLEVTSADDPASGGLLLALTPAQAQRTVTGASEGYAVLIRPDG